MIHTIDFGNELKRLGFQFFSGVPCSFLKYLINFAYNETTYVAAANEGDAVSIAAGAYLGGNKAAVLMQNSGLTNAISPLTSLNYPFKIPVLAFVSLRGEEGLHDEPQHELMGQITTKLIEDMGITWEYLSTDHHEAIEQLHRANSYIEGNKSFFFIIKKNTFDEVVFVPKEQNTHHNKVIICKSHEDQLPPRFEALKMINQLKDKNTIQLATTGKTGRELYQIEDAANNLYMVGSMGCVGSLGLGLAMNRKEKDIIVIDGDGSLLMRMGSLAVNGYYHPQNLLHILLDNNSYESTGKQKTVSDVIDFVQIASSSGYSKSIYVHTLEELEHHILEWKKNKALTFLYQKITNESIANLGRPAIKPYEIKERLQVFMND